MEQHPHPNSIESGWTEPSTDLLSLPPELILHIFTFVGFENFRQDIGRLAVSKKWYAHARPTFLSTIRLDSNRLGPILFPMEESPTLATLDKATKHIDLVLGMDPEWCISWDQWRPIYLPHWIVSCLEKLVSNLKDFAALRTLIIRPRGRFVMMPSSILPSFASLNQLTSLKVDLSNMVFEPSLSHHSCESISQLIPRLKVLHCRLPHICNDLLKSPPGDLQELIINIGVSESLKVEPRHCSEHFVNNYEEHFPDSYEELRTSLETRLVQFAASMRDPKIVLLIHKTRHSREKYAFDAIENRRLLSWFGNSTMWDADGVLLPDAWISDDESDNDGESDDGGYSGDEGYSGDDGGSDEGESFYAPGEESDNYRDSGHTDDEENGDNASDEE